jgi:hypothetical protein
MNSTQTKVVHSIQHGPESRFDTPRRKTTPGRGGFRLCPDGDPGSGPDCYRRYS